MNICPTCRREMTCQKTGVTVHFGGGHCYAGDRYQCPVCKGQVVVCNNQPYHAFNWHDERFSRGRAEIIEMTENLAKAVENLATSMNRAIAAQLK